MTRATFEVAGSIQRLQHFLGEFRRLADDRLADVGARATRWQAFPIRTFVPGAPIAAPHALLVGDAAGCDPLMGEGISYALEYGIMAAYAEGLNVLHRANIGNEAGEVSAELAPLEEPRYYQFDIDTPAVAELWRRGSVVSSWLLDLTASALRENPTLDGLAGRVSDSGEGRWTIKAAIDEGVPVPVLSAALYQRFSSRGEAAFGDKLLSAMRYEFGGHLEKSAS